MGCWGLFGVLLARCTLCVCVCVCVWMCGACGAPFGPANGASPGALSRAVWLRSSTASEAAGNDADADADADDATTTKAAPASDAAATTTTAATSPTRGARLPHDMQRTVSIADAALAEATRLALAVRQRQARFQQQLRAQARGMLPTTTASAAAATAATPTATHPAPGGVPGARGVRPTTQSDTAMGGGHSTGRHAATSMGGPVTGSALLQPRRPKPFVKSSAHNPTWHASPSQVVLDVTPATSANGEPITESHEVCSRSFVSVVVVVDWFLVAPCVAARVDVSARVC